MKQYYEDLEDKERQLRDKGNKTPKSDTNKDMEANRPEGQESTDYTWRGKKSFMSSKDMAHAKWLVALTNSLVKRGELKKKPDNLINWGDGQITLS